MHNLSAPSDPTSMDRPRDGFILFSKENQSFDVHFYLSDYTDKYEYNVIFSLHEKFLEPEFNFFKKFLNPPHPPVMTSWPEPNFLTPFRLHKNDPKGSFFERVKKFRVLFLEGIKLLQKIF